MYSSSGASRRALKTRMVGTLSMLVLMAPGCRELGPYQPWDWCPGQEVFESPGGGLRLEVGDRALYCAIPGSPGPDPTSVFSSLSRLLLIEGTYEVPGETGTFPVRLPLCAQLPEQGAQPTLGETGQLRVDVRSESWGQILRAWYDQTLNGPGGDTWSLTGRIDVTYEGALDAVAINGGDKMTFVLQGPADAWGRYLFGCGGVPSPNESVGVHFTGGHANLRVEVVMVSVAGGVPIGFLRSARGYLDGVSFEQTDYWDLAYVGGHHGWVNDYFIRFDQPIGPACGMWISDERYPEFSAVVRLLDCDLSVIEER